MVKLVPPIRAQVKRCEETFQSDKPAKTVERWYGEWKPQITRRVAELRAVDLTKLDNAGLDQHIGELWGFKKQSFEIHMLLNAALNIMLAEIAFSCRDLLGWNEGKTFDLVSGLSEASSEPSRALAAIARQAQRNPAAVSLLEKIGPETIEQLAIIEPELHTAFGQYLQEYGFRALRYDLAYPTLQERPEWILGLMHDQIRRGYDPAADEQALTARRAALVAEARGTLGQAAWSLVANWHE